MKEYCEWDRQLNFIHYTNVMYHSLVWMDPESFFWAERFTLRGFCWAVLSWWCFLCLLWSHILPPFSMWSSGPRLELACQWRGSPPILRGQQLARRTGHVTGTNINNNWSTVNAAAHPTFILIGASFGHWERVKIFGYFKHSHTTQILTRSLKRLVAVFGCIPPACARASLEKFDRNWVSESHIPPQHSWIWFNNRLWSNSTVNCQLFPCTLRVFSAPVYHLVLSTRYHCLCLFCKRQLKGSARLDCARTFSLQLI